MTEKILGSSVFGNGDHAGGQPYAEPSPEALAFTDVLMRGNYFDRFAIARVFDKFAQAERRRIVARLRDLSEEAVNQLAVTACFTTAYACGCKAPSECINGTDMAPEIKAACSALAEMIAEASPAATPIRQDAGDVTDETDTTAPTPVVTDEPEG